MGGTFGTIFIYPAVGLLLEAFSWQAPFYLGGVAAFAWCAAWSFLVTDEPTAHKCISREEADFIMANRSPRQPKKDLFQFCVCHAQFYFDGYGYNGF